MSSRTRSRVRPSIAVAKERISAVYRPDSPEKAAADTRNLEAIRMRDFFSEIEERERERKLKMKRRHSSVHSAPDKENHEPLVLPQRRRRFERSIGARGSVSSSKMDSASSSRSSVGADSRKSSSVGPLAVAPAADVKPKLKAKRKTRAPNGHTLTEGGNVAGPYTCIPKELRRQVEQDAIDFPEPPPLLSPPLSPPKSPQKSPLKSGLKSPKKEPPAPGGSPLDAPTGGWRLKERCFDCWHTRVLVEPWNLCETCFNRLWERAGAEVLNQQHRVEEKWCTQGDTLQQKLFNEHYDRLKRIVASLTGGKTELSFPQVEETAVSVMRACHFCGSKSARRSRFCTNCRNRYRL
ncbi:hypothetical protein M3Y99_01831100 [Aphelenchoides fujianensis]|nr:hypothetical protein M3Y99_01831100 [Aphelenchoides fujianensis]